MKIQSTTKIFLGGLVWIAVFVGFFFIAWGSFYSPAEIIVQKVCNPSNYQCRDIAQIILFLAWLPPAFFFARAMHGARRYVFLTGVVSALLLISINEIDAASLCPLGHEYGTVNCENLVAATLVPIFLVPLSFLLILFRDEVFRSWLRFVYWWVPLSILFILLDTGGGGGFLFSFDQGEFAALLTIPLFILISLIIIAWKYFAQPAKH